MDDARKIPTHEVTYARLRDMILYGDLQPGQPVTIQGLTGDLGAGMTPVREAIRRLTAEGALLPQGNRRVTVPRLTPGLLDQIAFARLTIEPKLAELACANASPDLIAQLEALDRPINAAILAQDVHAYLKHNHAFHFALYEASQAPVLVDMARSLVAAVRAVAAGRRGPRRGSGAARSACRGAGRDAARRCGGCGAGDAARHRTGHRSGQVGAGPWRNLIKFLDRRLI